MTRTGSCLAIATRALLALGAGALAFPDAARAQAPQVEVRLDQDATAWYPGQDVSVKLVFRGNGENETVIHAAAFARDAFVVRDAQGRAPKKISPPASGPAGPEPLTLRGFDSAERRVSLSAWYPGIASKPGVWEVTWSSGPLKAGPMRVHVVKAYEAGRDRVALVETELGRMTWELMPEHAPEHVKHFVDLARTGFYDGLTFFRLIPGVQAEGGDPKNDGTGAWGNLLRPEISTQVQMSAGLVGASRKETSMTSDSMFFITLTPSEYMLGKHTFYARVTKGTEVIARLHPLPNKGDTGYDDAFLLVKPVTIHRIIIK